MNTSDLDCVAVSLEDLKYDLELEPR